MKILCVDAMNMIHRARSGFTMGPAPVVYNFFRGFRALVEMHDPSRVFVVFEGHPKARHAALPTYKANRIDAGELDDPGFQERVRENELFFAQANLISSLLATRFPVSAVRHPDHECDDTIYNLIKRSSTAVPWVVASNDSDFTQLLCEFDHVKVYNPMKKTYVEKPAHDYVTWKALRGDATDNIPGLMSDAAATKIVNEPELLKELFLDDRKVTTFTRNYDLIKFFTWTDEESEDMESSSPTKDWDDVKSVFDSYGFRSITKDETWKKFTNTFDKLWG